MALMALTVETVTLVMTAQMLKMKQTETMLRTAQVRRR